MCMALSFENQKKLSMTKEQPNKKKNKANKNPCDEMPLSAYG